CPNRDGAKGTGGCIYCNSRGSGTGASARASITEQIREAQPFLRNRYKAKKFIAYFQSFSNTYAPVERLRDIYGEALAAEDIVGLSIGTRPDCVGNDVLDLLADLSGRTWLSLELGLQSIRDRTLALINRGHAAADFYDAVSRTRSRGIELCVHVILGLPGETRVDMLETARAIGSLGITGIKIHLQYVVRGTALHQMYERGEYRCLEREEYVGILCEFLALLPPDMVIHRLTGDPHRDELIAPVWALEKETTLLSIRETLRGRDLRQGKHWKKD
ncbi:MAG: TIGR01212 family radical SAM protein, partial [Candidatus Latescibacterota bacterium]